MLLRYLIKKIGGFWAVRKKAKKYFIYKILYGWYVESKNAYIPLSTDFKGTPYFPHGIAGIFISSDSIIGRDCVIYHQVTIGSNNLPDSKGVGAPIIGDNVYIGAGAKIIGNVTIGENVRIGANCVIAKDIPSNSVVVSQSPRIIRKDSINNKLYYRKNGDWGYYKNGTWIKEEEKNVLDILNARKI